MYNSLFKFPFKSYGAKTYAGGQGVHGLNVTVGSDSLFGQGSVTVKDDYLYTVNVSNALLPFARRLIKYP